MQNLNPTAGLTKVHNPKDESLYMWADRKQIAEFGLKPWGEDASAVAPPQVANQEPAPAETGGADPTKIKRGPPAK